VLDEPTSGVDPDGRDIIRDLVREERDAGRTIVVSTHELDEAQRVADRVCVIAGGRDVLSGRVDELTASSELRIVLNREPATVAGLPRGARIEGTILVGPAQDSDFVAAATAWLAANDVTISSMSSTHSLESVYRDALREARS
jgi:ABC-2 type transport system ATP-binding protein